ncbi:MAG: MFS transporter [Acidobacteria bacterium]|nr:MFS transporter [Acidobacteriota bacterium]
MKMPPNSKINMQSTPAKSGLFYGYFIVAVSTLAMMLSNGFSIGGLPAFYPEMLKEMGSLGQAPNIARASAVTFILSGLLSPFAGQLLRRLNVKVFMSLGCLLLGMGLFLYSQAYVRPQIYAAHVLFGLTLCFLSLIPNTVLISNWFRQQRGTAMGIAVTGTSLGTVVIPLVASPLIRNYGWRNAMLLMSASVWVLLLPLIWLIVRIRPQEVGQLPDGKSTGEALPSSPPDPASLPGMTLSEAFRTPLFWIFSVCAMMLFYAILAVVQQLIIFLTSAQIGMTGEAARGVQALMGTASIGGKLIFGVASDRWPRPKVNALCCAVLAAGCCMLPFLSAQNATTFAVLFGLGYGGAFVTIQLLMAECFGLRDLGRIIACIAVIETAGGALGNIITGEIAQRFDSYVTAYYGVIIASFIALLSGLFLVKKTVAFSEIRHR